MSCPRILLLATLALALPMVAHAESFQTYGVGLSVDPKVEVCKTVQHVEETCPILSALHRLWDKFSTEERSRRRVTEEMDAERAALAWARERYANEQYRVEITSVDESRGVPGRGRPRKITLSVSARSSDWMTRLQVMASEKKGTWTVQSL